MAKENHITTASWMWFLLWKIGLISLLKFMILGIGPEPPYVRAVIGTPSEFKDYMWEKKPDWSYPKPPQN